MKGRALIPAAIALLALAGIGVLYLLKKEPEKKPAPPSAAPVERGGQSAPPPAPAAAPAAEPPAAEPAEAHAHGEEESENRAQAYLDELYPAEEVAPTEAPAGEVVPLPERPPPMSAEEKLERIEKLIPTLELRLKKLEEQGAAANKIELQRLRERIAGLKQAVKERRVP